MKGISDSLHMFCTYSLTSATLLFDLSLRGIITETITFLLPDVKFLAKSTIDLLHSGALLSVINDSSPHQEFCGLGSLPVCRVWHSPSYM